MTDFDPIAYEEDVKARAAAAEEAALAEEVEVGLRKEKVGPAAAYTQAWRAVSQKLPKNLSKAMYLGLLNTAETIDDLQGAVNASATMSGLPVQPGLADNDKEPPTEQPEFPEPIPPLQTDYPEFFEAAHALADSFNEDASAGDHIVQGIGQFVIPFTGWLKLMGGLKGASKMQKVGRAVGAEAVTAGTAFDPQEGRIADLLQMGRQMENNFGRLLNTVAPDESAFNAYINMMTDRENEGEWEGRFKNVVDSLVLTGAGAALIKAVPTTLRAARQIAEEAGTAQAGSRKAQRGSVGVSSDELTDIERARALKNTVVEEVDGEHIVLEGDDLNTDADIVPIDKDKK